jgi:GNAT superfamily N-acetyltransferase
LDTVREARPDETRAVARALSLAFEDDPVMEFLFPSAATRVGRLRAFYTALIPIVSRHGRVQTHDGLRAAAVWQAPSPPRPGTLRSTWDGLRMAAVLRRALGRADTLNDTILPAHLHEPHWYLSLLGTEPAHQGRGLGSRLLAPVLERCDRDGRLAYLESSKAANIPFYERHGFEVTGELAVPGGPRIWPMLRRPRTV